MCFFRRIVYAQCSHAYPSDPSPARKCALQLAYERGEAVLPCGRIGAHSYASLRVGGRCRRCARADGALGRIREELRRARLRLGIPVAGAVVKAGDGEEKEGKGDGVGSELEGEGEGEELSPVALTFSSVVLGVPVELRSCPVSMKTTSVGDEAQSPSVGV